MKAKGLLQKFLLFQANNKPLSFKIKIAQAMNLPSRYDKVRKCIRKFDTQTLNTGVSRGGG